MLLKEVLIICVLIQCSSANRKCQGRRYGFDSIVCVCNATYCDTITSPPKLSSSKFYLYTSNAKGLRFKKIVGKFEKTALYINGVAINRTKKFQTILGFGGSFSDSTGINIASLDNKTQDNLLNAYFSSEGIEYNLARIPIGGTDFSLREYTYDDGPPDPELENFKLQVEDLKYKIPYMKQALQLRQGRLSFIGSAWSAPDWMRIDGDKDGHFSTLKPDMYEAWANYHRKFIEEYQKNGLEIWAITTGNEPSGAFVYKRFNQLGWMSDMMRKWIIENLGPTFRTYLPNVKILILDDNRFFLPWVVQLVIIPSTTEYIDGIALHWYTDSEFSPKLLNETHELFPDKFMLNTESSIESYTETVALGSWRHGEMYSYDIIEDLSHWVVGWMDWNMVLDINGGPSWMKNHYLNAAIIVNSKAGEFYKQPMYYHIGHFSKFVHTGSRRIYAKSNYEDKFSVIAFERPDNAIVVVILNESDKTIPITVFDSEREAAKITISKRSINTLIYW